MFGSFHEFLNAGVGAVARTRRRLKAGDLFGVEVELEGGNVTYKDGFQNDEILNDWEPLADGSLRDRHGPPQEWVFRGPVKYPKAVKRINDLFDYLAARRANIVTSNRTSVHVHFNMGDKSVYQVLNLFILFTIFEDILDNFCGDTRKGNLFCLSSRLADHQVEVLTRACVDEHSLVMPEGFRYCSLNLAALNKFGTVEFRGMRGVDNRQDLLNWLKIVNELCLYACYTLKNPVSLIEDVSLKTPVKVLREVFSEESADLLTRALTEEYISNSVYEGLRLVQVLCYRVGSDFDKVKVKGQDFWAAVQEDPAPGPPEENLLRGDIDAFPGLGLLPARVVWPGRPIGGRG